ncbi:MULTISPECIES: LacI family DNA-binding transcriptional regulator [Rhizobium]|uniref:LacI family transcriptional regulator n=1 Tax=Rhizobium leguminosarum TaxID=384 RepID=A0A4Q8XEJ9_RHILE|nr:MULTISPECIES: LacI family DNA-binding transcriptional regulator [Rhizobium]MBY5317925.1 LacI family transcriptional regulator [Rhizobium leguminosarum]MDV4152886.1 LacI family DNA-binding transcriptional regulator [Rhizobium brockwellii]TAU82462.1 LacI family transcriptional regulator [Rhizobium leguminosarum]TAU87728.1 LacI family transcriptional regulator [Rhizobium leguminosarum]TAV47390.1 LacI family transcriptional regulator [Rhizobium leguminosarum]
MATITDVARVAGVSVSTVSHVVNGTRHVNDATAALVRQAIETLGFVPNAVARSLVRSSTDAVGIAISISTNYYFNDIVSSIERACAAIGQLVFLCDTQNDPETELRLVRELVQRRVDGVILAPSGDPENRAIDYLKSSRMPFVLVDRLTVADADGVCLDNETAMETLIDHLVGHGHRRIGLIAGEPGLLSTIERVRGYVGAMRKHGLEIDRSLMSEGNANSADARQSALEILSRADRPTAIASGNNLATIGVMRAVRDLGLRISEDLALIGFDDFDWADCFEPRLTVMAQPSEMIGMQAAEMLSRRIKSSTEDVRQVRLPAKLVIRRSCGCGGH